MLLEIPTRGRPDWLAMMLSQLPSALANVIRPVELLLIESGELTQTEQVNAAIKALSWWGITTLRCAVQDDLPLPEKHQIAYNLAKERHHEIVMILHDDLILTSPFMVGLQDVLKDVTIGAVAGIYPYLGAHQPSMLSEDYRDQVGYNGEIEAATNWHQVYAYPSKDVELEPVRTDVQHLFGPVMYRVSALPQGFPVGVYSRVSHREETDFTHQIYRNDYKLAVCKTAVAFHAMYPKGGAAEDRETYMRDDEAAFKERLNASQSHDNPESLFANQDISA